MSLGCIGSGREYVNDLMLQHVGERAKYFKNLGGPIHFRRIRTSMIYSGHATIKHVSFGQALPAVTSRLVEAAKSGLADLIFIYRHPLDTLLTGWVWGCQIIRGIRMPGYISQVYRNTDDLCADLEKNFSELQGFFRRRPGLVYGRTMHSLLVFRGIC